MNKLNELKELIASMEGDVEKFFEKRNKAAGVRVRKNLQEVKTLAQELRLEISAKNKED